nr:SPOR domain-containing protein [Pseudomonadota bacterium]
MSEEWREPSVGDGDRLPWLETASDDLREGPSLGRVMGLVIVGLAVIALVIFGIHWAGKRRLVDGGGAVIAAPDGDYKVKPEDAGGMKVTGEGNSAIATSDGENSDNASINLGATPEQPVNGTHVAAGGPAS